MTAQIWFQGVLVGWLALAALAFGLLWFIPAPYGRHVRRGWGPTLSGRWAWLLMEAPAPLLMATFFLSRGAPWGIAQTLFLILWEAHYVYRAFIYPWGLPPTRRPMPLGVVGMGFAFNLINGSLNGYDLFWRSTRYDNTWLAQPHFVLGVTLFVIGMIINRHADRTLGQLRRSAESGYAIPQGGLFRWVSCPNYLGEIIEWLGWALATQSVAGLAFALWVIANLAPRARAHHLWYRQRFADYPAARRALLPGLW